MSDIVSKIMSVKDEIPVHVNNLSGFVKNVALINTQIHEMFLDKNDARQLLQSTHEFDKLIKNNRHEHMVNIIQNGSNDWIYFMTNFNNFMSKIPEGNNVHTLDTMITHVDIELHKLLETLKLVHKRVLDVEIKDGASNKILFKFDEVEIRYVETINIYDIATLKIEEYTENNKNINTRGQEIAKTLGMLITNAFTEDILARISLLKSVDYRPEVLAKHNFIKGLMKEGKLKGGDISSGTIKNMSDVISIFEDINIKFYEINVDLKKYKANYDMYIKNHNDNVYYMLYMQSVVKNTTEYPKLIPLHIINIMIYEIDNMIEKLKLINPINNHINERYSIVINTIKQFLDAVKIKIIESGRADELMSQKIYETNGDSTVNEESKEETQLQETKEDITPEETMPEKTYEDVPHEETKEETREETKELKPNNPIDVFKCDIKSQYMFNVVYQFRKILKGYNDAQKIEK